MPHSWRRQCYSLDVVDITCLQDPDVARLSLVQEDVETTFVTYGTLGCAFVGHSVVLLTFAGVRYVLLRPHSPLVKLIAIIKRVKFLYQCHCQCLCLKHL